MASFEGSIGTPSGGFNLKVEYSISQSVPGNYSDVTATGYVKRNKSSYYPYNSTSSASLNIGGDSANASPSYNLGSDGYKTIMSHSARIYHNSDGTKSITISFSFNGKLSNYYPNGSISQTITLPSIPRQANISTAPDFNDEENPTITYSNSAGNSVSSLDACISLTGSKDDVPYRSINKTGTLSYTFDLTEEERNILRQATTTSNSRTIYFYIRTIIGGVTYYSKIAKTFSIVNATPDFNDFEFTDINPTTVRLLEGEEATTSQSVILGYSQVQVTIPVANKAIAKKEATMSKYRFNSIDVNYSDTEDVSITSNAVTSGDFTVYAIDGRGNSKPVTKNAINVISYTPLQKGNITANRQNGVSENTILKFDGKVDLINFGAVENSIISSKYRFKIAGASDDDWSDEFDLVLDTDEQGNFNFEGLIKGDTEALGFNISNAYNVEVIIEDNLSKITYTVNLGSGTPHIAYAKNGVGIMGKYDESVGGKGQVDGNPLAYYPIGSIYISVNETNPKTLFGGTWEQIKDTFLLSAGDIYKAGTTGGEAEVTLTVEQIPPHKHEGYLGSSSGDVWRDVYLPSDSGTKNTNWKKYDSLLNTGGGQPHNNMPPYLTVYMWKRTA